MDIRIFVTADKQADARELTAVSFEDAVSLVKDVATQSADGTHPSVTVALAEGIYPVSAPIVFDAESSPELRRIALTVRGEGKAVLTGAEAIDTARFAPVEGKPYYELQLEKVNGEYPAFEDFYVDGVRIPMAKSESFCHPFGYESPVKEDPVNLVGMYLPERFFASMRDKEAIGAAQVVVYIEWFFKSIEIDFVDFDDVREHDGERYVRVHYKNDYMSFINGNNGWLGIGGRMCHILNSDAYLAPGTFTYNPWTGVLHYYPEDTLEGHELRYSTLENLMTVRGMRDLRFENLTFSGITTGYRIKNSYSSGQANCESRVGRLAHAAFITYNVENVTFEGCAFSELG